MAYEHITNHVEQALRRLLSQFKGKPRLEGTISAFVNPIQDIEDMFADMYTLRELDTAFGQQLDGIGQIVGRARRGFNDEKYRLRLIGQIGINTSKGTPENLISIFNLLTGSTNSTYSQFPIAECSIFGNVPPLSGIELLQDGDMEGAGTSSWTPENSATLTKSTAAPYEGLQSLRVAYNGVADPGASQSILEVGQWYLARGRVKMENALGPVPIIKNGAITIYAGAPYAGWYDFDVVFFSSDAKIIFGSDHSAAGWVEYDACSVQLMQLDNWSDIYEICQSIIPGGVRLNAIGWYSGADAFAFFDSPDGKGFGDLNDPTIGGKFASLT